MPSIVAQLRLVSHNDVECRRVLCRKLHQATIDALARFGDKAKILLHCWLV